MINGVPTDNIFPAKSLKVMKKPDYAAHQFDA